MQRLLECERGNSRGRRRVVRRDQVVAQIARGQPQFRGVVAQIIFRDLYWRVIGWIREISVVIKQIMLGRQIRREGSLPAQKRAALQTLKPQAVPPRRGNGDVGALSNSPSFHGSLPCQCRSRRAIDATT